MGWRVVLIEESDRLSIYLDNLKVSRNDHDILIPIKDIHSLIIDNYKLVLSVQMLNKCVENNVNIVTCGIDHSPKALVIPIAGHHRMVGVLRNQLEWTNELKSVAHREIVIAKIKNQIKILERCGISEDNVDKLRGYVLNVEESDKTNREGLAAKVYFRLLFGDGFQRFNEDVLNGGLNYGYSILRSMISKVVLSKGLNTALGIIHIGPYNMFNLCDDIIEPYRPIVDEWVFANLRYATEFTREHRQSLVKMTTRKVYINGQFHTLMNSMVLMTESIIDFFNTGNMIVFPEMQFKDDL